MSDPRRLGQSLDTTPDALTKQIEQWRTMTPGEKAQLVVALNRATREMAEAGIAARHPDATPRERFLRLAMLRLGRPLAAQAYPEIAQLAP